MAQASAALALATTTAQSFKFPTHALLKVQVRFYSDAAGTAPVAAGTGARTLTATTTGSVFERGESYRDRALVSSINGGAIADCVGGTWYKLDLFDGLNQVNIAATGGTDPGTAVSYRIIVDAEGGV